MRAIGIVRQSSTRDPDGTASPAEQAERLRHACQERGLELLRIVEELDVSGGTPLTKRKGLREAVEAVEAGEAEVIVGAYFDRLVRSLKVQAELVERVEAKGGQVLALDTGQVTNGSAGQWLSGTLLGAVAEYQRRTTSERVSASHQQAIARGVVPYPIDLPGYVRLDDGRLIVDPVTAPVVADAFRVRAAGATIATVRRRLAEAGIVRSYRATQTLLKSRLVLGEIHFGTHKPNLQAHDPIVDRGVWEAVQRVRVPVGRPGQSPRLLARLNVLKCAGCMRPMVAGSSVANGTKYFNYRCQLSDHDCPDRQVISARIVEPLVERAVRVAISDAQGGASMVARARADRRAADAASDEFARVLRMFTAAAVGDEPEAAQRLTELRDARDAALERAEVSESAAGSMSITVDTDWDRMTFAERRSLIRVVLDDVVVRPGRGASRVDVRLRFVE